MKNKHKNMILKSFWTTEDEFNKIITCLEGNEKEKLFDLFFKIKERGDLK